MSGRLFLTFMLQVRKIAGEKKLSQKQIADSMGIHQTAVSKYFGGREIDLDTAEAMARAVGTNLFDILFPMIGPIPTDDQVLARVRAGLEALTERERSPSDPLVELVRGLSDTEREVALEILKTHLRSVTQKSKKGSSTETG